MRDNQPTRFSRGGRIYSIGRTFALPRRLSRTTHRFAVAQHQIGGSAHNIMKTEFDGLRTQRLPHNISVCVGDIDVRVGGSAPPHTAAIQSKARYSASSSRGTGGLPFIDDETAWRAYCCLRRFGGAQHGVIFFPL